MNEIYESYHEFSDTTIGIKSQTRAESIDDEIDIDFDSDQKINKHNFKKNFRKVLKKSQTIDLKEIKVIFSFSGK